MATTSSGTESSRRKRPQDSPRTARTRSVEPTETAETAAELPTPDTTPSAAEKADALLPSREPIQLLDENGHATGNDYAERGYAMPSPELLKDAWRRMVIARRYDTQCTALTKQGRLAVYPSGRGQDACQVGPIMCLDERDWFFPTYRDSMGIQARGLDPREALTLLQGDWHCGYDPIATRTAPQCTPLATQIPHTAGVAYAMKRRGSDGVALAYIGDGGTSEGDFHEGLNFAAVFHAPAIFFVQNNGFAISVPLERQTAAPTLAYKGVGYGIRSELIDGNDIAAVLAVMTEAVRRSRETGEPFLIEAITFRMEAHTNADDASRYRESDTVTSWLPKDPISRVEKWLVENGHLTEDEIEQVKAEAEQVAADLRDAMNTDTVKDPMALFEHVYAEPTPLLVEERDMVARELAAAGEEH